MKAMRSDKMRIIILAIAFLTVSCGEEIKEEASTPRRADITRRTVVNTPGPEIESYAIDCFKEGSHTLDYHLKGNYYRGTILQCFGHAESCDGFGRYLHYLEGGNSCLAKRGFENEFTVCLEGKVIQRASPSGPLVKLRLIENGNGMPVWCEKNVLEMLLPPVF